jgi:DNA-binding PadR family transcriptional regulator
MPRTPNRSRQTRKLLAAMLENPMAWRHGYELLKITGLKSGTLYPALLRLSEQGLLEAQWREADEPGKPPRHVYRLTRAGLAFARAESIPADDKAAAGLEVLT